MRVMPPRVRKLALTLHVLSSVGWCGAVAGSLALALAGLRGADLTTVRSAYPSMNMITNWVIVPMSLGSLLSGVVSSVGTPWGLIRHYWVIAKLVVTSVSTALLLLHTRVIEYVALAAARASVAGDDFHRLRLQLAADAAAAIVALVVTTALAIYKPRGVTAAGRRHDAAG